MFSDGHSDAYDSVRKVLYILSLLKTPLLIATAGYFVFLKDYGLVYQVSIL